MATKQQSIVIQKNVTSQDTENTMKTTADASPMKVGLDSDPYF